MTPHDLRQLRRCVALAAEAAARGDDPFGSLLVDARGQVLAERASLVHTSRDNTAHPELMLASWACQHMTPQERAGATMYTSGEHCAMCAAAHVWAGIGRLVFVLSAEQLGALLGPGPSIAVTARELIARSTVPILVEGPCEALAAAASALFTRGGQP